jgi:2-polyprenyl-3-methyl-5-hydroxy-6-metoxy-1,4-benzoquinol methylase
MSEHYGTLHKSHLADREFRILNARKCLQAVKRHIQFDSVVDFGCGIGGWLHAAKQLGATRVLGIEGDWIKQSETLIEESELRIADLGSEGFEFYRSFDLALSVEVGEHLPATSSDSLCDSMVNAANLLVFSAAISGQGGIDHVNEQKPSYWVDKFWQRNFVPLEMIRPAIANEPKMYPWLQQNLMTFLNYDLLSAQPHLARFALPRRHFYAKYWPM